MRRNNPPAPWSMGFRQVSMLDENVNVVIFVFYSEAEQPTRTLVNGWSPSVFLDESVNVVMFVVYSETEQPTRTLVNGWSPSVYA